MEFLFFSGLYDTYIYVVTFYCRRGQAGAGEESYATMHGWCVKWIDSLEFVSQLEMDCTIQVMPRLSLTLLLSNHLLSRVEK